MTVDPAVMPGLLLLTAEVLALAGLGYIVTRVVLRQTDDRMALAQGLLVGPTLWGLLVSFLLSPLPRLAGTLAGWAVMLMIGAILARRAAPTLRLRPRTLAGFSAVALALFCLALAARQLLIIPDAIVRVGLAASIQAGAWPPVLPWIPWQPIPYHYGASLLVGLLDPPVGPDLAFTTELLGAFAWTSLALVVGTALLRRGGWLSSLTLTPLLLTAGAWTLVFHEAPAALQLPVPGGLPTAGLRASLADIYWPAVEWPWSYPEPEASPPNIWKPSFTLAYGLAFVILERLTAGPVRPDWAAALTLAGLVGFLGLLEEAVALTVLGVWSVVTAGRVLHAHRARGNARRLVPHAALGPAAAALLLALGGGILADVLTRSAGGDLSIQWPNDPNTRHLLGSLTTRPGGVGMLGLGPLAVTAAALVVGWRLRLVLALAVGSGAFILAALTLEYQNSPDLVRLDGHARSFALLTLLVAVAARLAALRPRWRYAAAALIIALVAWPTIALPLRKLGRGLERGIHLANAQSGQPDFGEAFVSMGRYTLPPFASEHLTAYVRDHTPVNARVLSPRPDVMSLATGRPNASGFEGLAHYVWRTGPGYRDAIRFLEPPALQRLGITHVHATDAWVASLPDRSRRWLDDPGLFDLLVRDGADAFYRVRPAFLRLDPRPVPQSFEALRQALPASTNVYLTESLEPLQKIRLASLLPHTTLLATLGPSRLHLLTDIPSEPPGTRRPDVVVVARDLPFDVGTHRLPAIWWNQNAIAYAVRPSIAPTVDPPPLPEPDFSVRLSNVDSAADKIRFTATFTDHASDQWTGQDWLVVEIEDSPWAWPIHYEDGGYTLAGAWWFAGQAVPSSRPINQRYEFDALAGALAAQTAGGDFAPVQAAGDRLTPGVWVLAVRIRQHNLQAAVIPVLKIVISKPGDVTYSVYPGERRTAVNPCPERVRHTVSCRQLDGKTTSPVSPYTAA
ncbi:MAG: hypothetical protein OXG65_12040 [Chloroflexi bacterium]|nr:hypothetical protein [Chloroflexota bacterium]